MRSKSCRGIAWLRCLMYVTSDYSLFVGTVITTPTATSTTCIPPTCTLSLASRKHVCCIAQVSCVGQIIKPDPELCGCSAIADEFHVSTGEVRVATGNNFCGFDKHVCFPLPCETNEITKYGETCSDTVKQISNSTQNAIQERFSGWSPHLVNAVLFSRAT